MSFRTAELSVGQNGRGQDRARALPVAYADRVVLVVADGAGGSARGGAAAEAVIAMVAKQADDFDPAQTLRACDAALVALGGESTAVIAIVSANEIVGASVGDSAAWIIDGATHVELTERQHRKPLLGSGHAVVTAFRSATLSATATLLLATDGLIKYAPAARLRELATFADLAATPERLIQSVRLQSGALQDDTTVILCRRA